MARHHRIGGKDVQFTAEVELQWDKQEKEWSDNAPKRKLAEIREIRNQKLSETDYLAMTDNTMSEEMKTYRQSMRDIPQDYSEADYDDLLARDEQGNLTHTVWSKP